MQHRLVAVLVAVSVAGAAAMTLLGSWAAASPNETQAVKDVYFDFRMPSNNIFCAYVVQSSPNAKYLRCDIMSGLRPRPSSAGCVDGDRSISVSINATGRASYPCVGDTVKNTQSTRFPYGWTWRRGGFTCSSSTTGLRCRNLSGHGFFLSRQHSYLF
ncbi:MAG: DUF6636 domain-containing protein [Gaiellaceae bacterium]